MVLLVTMVTQHLEHNFAAVAQGPAILKRSQGTLRISSMTVGYLSAIGTTLTVAFTWFVSATVFFTLGVYTYTCQWRLRRTSLCVRGLPLVSISWGVP